MTRSVGRFSSLARGALLAALSALLLTLSFPRFDLHLLVWVALVPLLLGLRTARGLAGAFGLSLLTGIGFMMGVFYWINVVDGVKLTDFLLLGLYLGSYIGLFGLIFRVVSDRTRLPSVATAPLVWVSLEYLRAHAGFLAFPWALLGHSQYLNLPLAQISAITGVYGISFLIVMVNAGLTELLLARRTLFHDVPSRSWLTSAALPLLVLAGTVAYGLSMLSRPSNPPTIAVTVVQGNINQSLRWVPELRATNLAKHVGLTRDATSNGHTSLVVWPETSVQGFLLHNLQSVGVLSALAKTTNTHLLVGTAARPKFGPREFRDANRFNSAVLVSPTGSMAGKYDKIRLLPFGEYLPYNGLVPWPARYRFSAANLLPGKEHTIFVLDGARFGVTICWENIFPELFREFVRNGADFMVNITNEAWFGDTAAPRQMLAMSVFRAIENRVSIARSANTGISGFIDPHGRLIGKVVSQAKDVFVEGHLTRAIPLRRETTFYTSYGDLFARACLILAGGVLVAALGPPARLRSPRWITPDGP